MISLREIGEFIDDSPPPPLLPPPERQHLKSLGPGQNPDALLPEHWFVQRQFPPDEQDAFVQHFTSSGVPGHALEMYRPPSAEQDDVLMQTPGAPFSPVQGPFSFVWPLEPPERQHLKLVGPGQKPEAVEPEHCEAQRQFPPDEQEALVQHLTLSGVPGQALEMYRPPSAVQESVWMQTPGAPFSPVHCPLTSERAVRFEGVLGSYGLKRSIGLASPNEKVGRRSKRRCIFDIAVLASRNNGNSLRWLRRIDQNYMPSLRNFIYKSVLASLGSSLRRWWCDA